MSMNNQIIDLRSDTVTLPSEDMLDAIKSVKLGDDVFSEDPTVNSLQEKLQIRWVRKMLCWCQVEPWAI